MHTTIHFIDQANSDMERSLHIQNRSIIVDAHAFGTLRKDLISNLGMNRTKGFLFRYGWNMGVRDAKECKEKEPYQSMEELIEYGPVMHSIKGYVESKTMKLEIKNDSDRLTLQMDSVWEHSVEADEHLSQIGVGTSPVCYTLSGYASGFVSEILGDTVIFKENCCRAAGGRDCIAVGKSISLWNKEMIQEELYYLQETPIVKELELTYEKLLQQRNQLTLVNDIHKRLLEEVIKESSLKSIIEMVFQLCTIPVIIHNAHGHPITYAGFNKLSQGLTPNGLFQYININMSKNPVSQLFQPMNCHEHYIMLTNPIYLHEKRMGYCSFIIKEHQQELQELANLSIEKIASICSLCFLYEKTKFASFDQMKSYYLKEILSGQYSTVDELVTNAGLFQYDLSKPYYIGIIGYKFNKLGFHNEQSFCREVMSSVSHYMEKQKLQCLMNQSNHQINLFVTDYFTDRDQASLLFKELLEFLHSRFPGSYFHMGISKKTNSIETAPEAHKEAQCAQRLVSKNSQLIFFDTLGMVGALVNDSNETVVREMAHSLLKNLIASGQKNIDLIRTLYLFLINGGNLEKTADDLALSISGLRYRVSKVEELLQQDIRSPLISSQLLMAIQALIILGDLDLKTPLI